MVSSILSITNSFIFTQLMVGIHGISSFGGARGVVVIAVGNEHGDTSSNPVRY